MSVLKSIVGMKVRELSSEAWVAMAENKSLILWCVSLWLVGFINWMEERHPGVHIKSLFLGG